MKFGYSETEIGAIPEDWKRATLGDIAVKVGSGLTPTGGARVYTDEGRPFMRSQNVGWGTLLLDDLVFIDDSMHATFPDTEIREQDVLLNITGASIGRSAVADSRIYGGNVNQHVCIIRLSESALVPSYLNYLLLSTKGQQQIASLQAGGSRQGLNFRQVRTLQFAFPPRLEQQAIASALGAVDALLDGLTRLITKKRDLMQAALQQLLTGKTRLPGFRGEWAGTRLGDLAEMGSGGTPLSSVPGYYDGDIPWVSISDMTKGGKVIENTERTLTVLGLENSAAQMFPTGTVLYAMYASLGECSIAGIPLCTSQAILGIRAKNGLKAEFLYYYLTSMKRTVKALGQQGTQSNLNKGMVQDFSLALPPLPEQIAIAAVLSGMDEELDALVARRDKTHGLKQAMVQELLTGKTRLIAGGAHA